MKSNRNRNHTLVRAPMCLNQNGEIHQDVIEFTDGQITKKYPLDFDAVHLNVRKFLDFKNKITMPGFVNVHSHAFQRILRGRVERKNKDFPQDDFWTWRSSMYKAASTLPKSLLKNIHIFTYLEMLEAGYTSVGEFHYLHHLGSLSLENLKSSSQAIDSAFESSRLVIEAAKEVGIRLVLLQSAYQRGGFTQEASAAQQHFCFSVVDDYLEHCQNIRAAYPDEQHGLSIHSVRACDAHWIQAITKEAKKENLPLHIHASEQQSEVNDCLKHTGLRPVQWLEKNAALFENTVLIHATHLDQKDMELMKLHKVQVNLCPSTERNLGDGLCPIKELHDRGISLSIGSDSHAHIDPFEELRSIEGHERLRLERRCVLQGAQQGLASAVIPIGTQNGAKALHIDDQIDHQTRKYQIKADMIACKRNDAFEYLSESEALDDFILSASPQSVTDVFVRGEHLIADRKYQNFDPQDFKTEFFKELKIFLQR